MSEFFFFNDTATTEIYTLSLHDALPIYMQRAPRSRPVLATQPIRRMNTGETAREVPGQRTVESGGGRSRLRLRPRSEEHTSELQSRQYLVCRLLLEKKNVNT